MTRYCAGQITTDIQVYVGINSVAGETEAMVHEKDKKLGYVIMGLVLGIPLAIGLLSFLVGLIVSIFVS